MLSYFLKPENASIWAEVQAIAQKGDDAALHAYVSEAQRLTTSQRNVRIATAPGEIDGQTIQSGTAVVLLLVSPIILQQEYEISNHSTGRGWP